VVQSANQLARTVDRGVRFVDQPAWFMVRACWFTDRGLPLLVRRERFQVCGVRFMVRRGKFCDRQPRKLVIYSDIKMQKAGFSPASPRSPGPQ
jgi:hypothetical protein